MGAVVTMMPCEEREEDEPIVPLDCRTEGIVEAELEACITSLMEEIQTVRTRINLNSPRLIRAAAAGNRKEVRTLVGSGNGLNVPGGDFCRKTPLHWAVLVDNASVIRHLLTLGRRDADPGAGSGGPRLRLDATDSRGLTALHYAAVTHNLLLVHLLLEEGASVDCRDLFGQTALIKAAIWEDAELCRVLLDAGADARAADAIGWTALHAAAATGCAATTQLLLQRGASTAAADHMGCTPLNYALRCATATADGVRCMPLSYALRCGTAAAADAANAVLRNYTPRHWKLPAARVLLPAAEYTPCEDNVGFTELHWAAINGTEDIVRPMLSFRRPRWLCDEEATKVLIMALAVRNEATARALLEVPATEAVTDDTGMNALHWAARVGLPWAVKQLLERGWSAWRHDHQGRDVLMSAVLGKDDATVAQVLHVAGFRQRADRFGRTALHLAAVHGSAATVLTLLRHGADADAVDRSGWTPIRCANYYGTDSVDLLWCHTDRPRFRPRPIARKERRT